MKKAMTGAWLALALTTACGEEMVKAGLPDTSTPEKSGQDTTSPGDTTVAPKSEALTVDVRVRATGIDSYLSLMMLPRALSVRIDGVETAVDLTDAPVDLALSDQANRIGSFALPADAKMVEVAVAMSPAGVFESLDGIGWLDSRSTVMRFVSSGENLRGKSKAVLVLDAASSLHERAVDELALVPRYRVLY